MNGILQPWELLFAILPVRLVLRRPSLAGFKSPNDSQADLGF
jgi:hypothetical protein